MPRDECRNGHQPVDAEIQYNGPEMLVTARCDACGYDLETIIQDTDWLAVESDIPKEASDG